MPVYFTRCSFKCRKRNKRGPHPSDRLAVSCPWSGEFQSHSSSLRTVPPLPQAREHLDSETVEEKTKALPICCSSNNFTFKRSWRFRFGSFFFFSVERKPNPPLLRMFWKTSWGVSSLNGGTPVRNSKRHTPSAHQSTMQSGRWQRKRRVTHGRRLRPPRHSRLKWNYNAPRGPKHVEDGGKWSVNSFINRWPRHQNHNQRTETFFCVLRNLVWRSNLASRWRQGF